LTRIAAGLALAVAMARGAVAAPPVEQLIEARELICDFYVAKDWATAEARFALHDRSDMLMVIENIQADPDTARVTDSQTAGRRKLRRYVGETGVHFVEDRDGSVSVTTILACEDWKKRRGRDVCARYSAVNSWLFGVNVQRDPDEAIRRAPVSYRGACEPWNPN
jgi:hypothetical protein